MKRSVLLRFAAAVTLVCLFGLLLAPGIARADGFAAVRHAARAEGVPERLAVAVATTETHGRCHMTGAAGEQGVMQVKPAIARSVGVFGNLYDCHTGATAGVRYLRQALRRAGGSWLLAAHLYNAGLAARPRRSRYAALVMGHAH
jgi:soluble lytic murein transglycosylase-like protein